MAVQAQRFFPAKWVQFFPGPMVSSMDTSDGLFPVNLDLSNVVSGGGNGVIEVSPLTWLLIAQGHDENHLPTDRFITRTKLGTMMDITVTRLNIVSDYVRVTLKYMGSQEVTTKTGTILTETSSTDPQFAIASIGSDTYHYIRSAAKIAVQSLMSNSTNNDWDFWDQN